MTSPELYNWMKNPEVLSSETLPVLRDLVEQYPSFHAVQMLYLKNLYTLQDEHYEDELHRLSVSIPDRRKLFLFVEGAHYGLTEKKEEPKDLSDSFSLIDQFLTKHPSEGRTNDEILFQPSASSDYLLWSQSDGVKKEERKERKQESKEPVVASSEQNQNDRLELIDQFLENAHNPIHLDESPASSKTPETLKEQNDEQSRPLGDSYFTETLARIFIRQKRYEKALQIIQSLSLKYPEKNIYFADQIRFLEKLIINTKK